MPQPRAKPVHTKISEGESTEFKYRPESKSAQHERRITWRNRRSMVALSSTTSGSNMGTAASTFDWDPTPAAADAAAAAAAAAAVSWAAAAFLSRDPR